MGGLLRAKSDLGATTYLKPKEMKRYKKSQSVVIDGPYR